MENLKNNIISFNEVVSNTCTTDNLPELKHDFKEFVLNILFEDSVPQTIKDNALQMLEDVLFFV